MLSERAKAEGRSVSNYVMRLVDADFKARGLLDSDKKAEILASAAEVGEEKTLEILRRAVRREKGAAA